MNIFPPPPPPPPPPPLTKISKFTTVFMPIIVENKVEVSYLYKGTINDPRKLSS